VCFSILLFSVFSITLIKIFLFPRSLFRRLEKSVAVDGNSGSGSKKWSVDPNGQKKVLLVVIIVTYVGLPLFKNEHSLDTRPIRRVNRKPPRSSVLLVGTISSLKMSMRNFINVGDPRTSALILSLSLEVSPPCRTEDC
jgi:hypothetical protein